MWILFLDQHALALWLFNEKPHDMRCVKKGLLMLVALVEDVFIALSIYVSVERGHGMLFLVSSLALTSVALMAGSIFRVVRSRADSSALQHESMATDFE